MSHNVCAEADIDIYADDSTLYKSGSYMNKIEHNLHTHKKIN